MEGILNITANEVTKHIKETKEFQRLSKKTSQNIYQTDTVKDSEKTTQVSLSSRVSIQTKVLNNKQIQSNRNIYSEKEIEKGDKSPKQNQNTFNNKAVSLLKSFKTELASRKMDLVRENILSKANLSLNAQSNSNYETAFQLLIS